MGLGYFGDRDDTSVNNPQAKGLLGAGWRPLSRQIDWGFLLHLVSNDTWELTHKTLNIASDLADALGRNDYAWWANTLSIFSDNSRYKLDEFGITSLQSLHFQIIGTKTF